MLRRTHSSTRTDTLVPYTALVRSRKASSIHPEVLSFHPLEGFFFVIENHTADFLAWFGGVLFGKLYELLVRGCASRQCWGLQQTQSRDPTVPFAGRVLVLHFRMLAADQALCGLGLTLETGRDAWRERVG